MWADGTGGWFWTRFTRSFCATNILKQTDIVLYKIKLSNTQKQPKSEQKQTTTIENK